MKPLKMLVSMLSMLLLFSVTPPNESVIISDEGVRQSPEITAVDELLTYRLTEMSKKETADSWLKIAVTEIKAKAEKLKVRDTGALIASISGSIQELSGGDSYKAQILYNYYGIFPDMGLGKGIQRGDKNVAKLMGFKRKAKPWTREIAAQRHRFGEVMGKTFADDAIKTVKEGLLNKVEFKA